MPRAYYDRFMALDVAPGAAYLRKRVAGIPALVDTDRFVGFTACVPLDDPAHR